MTPGESNNAGPRPDESPRRRRPRYSGTYPKRFDHRYKELQPEAYPDIHEHVRSRGRTPAGTHVPILVNEVMEHLRPAAGEVVADCTVGYGGHALEFLRRIGPTGRLIGLDVDGGQLERTGERLAAAGGFVRLHRSNFAGIDKILREEQLDGYDVVFADLGLASMQIDDPARGFSYKQDGPLDMRMDDRLHRTAADLLASISVDRLSQALCELADEPDHEAVARTIAERRVARPITRTLQLADLILESKGLSARTWRRQTSAGPGALHPAARTFQALRMLVNDELEALEHLLRIAPYCLRPGGRIGILSFHSGEDRRVKHSFRDNLRAGVYEVASEEVIRAGSEERRSNPRSTSAKFRWARKPLR